MKHASFTAALFIFFAVLISSCGSDSQPGTPAPVQDTAAPQGHNTQITDQDFFYSLPSPLLMARVFKKTGLKYVHGLANSPEYVSKYSSGFSKTLNLGVYSTDLAYSVINKQSQQAAKYMEAIKKLSDDLGMSSLFDAEDYLNRFKNNLSNEDSLIHIVSQLKSEMDIFMRDNNKEKETLVIFIGAWLENMYIATQLTKEVTKDGVATRIAEQKYIFNNLMNSMNSFHQHDKDVHGLFLKLNDLKEMFDNLSVEGESEALVLDIHQLKLITEKTRILRKEIVTGE